MSVAARRQGLENAVKQSRRQFFGSSTLLAASALAAGGPAEAAGSLHFGLVTDTHYADIEPAIGRAYRESTDKLAECVRAMNERRVSFLVELGDFKDQGTPPEEAATLGYLRTIEKVFAGFEGPRFHVLGNHDMDSLSKQQFLEAAPSTGIAPGRSYYAFDRRGVRFIALDGCFRPDGVAYDHGNFDWEEAIVPAAELGWLERQLALAPGRVVVFVHQRLDGSDRYCVRNAEAVRSVLEQSGKVAAVFQGHHHEGGYAFIRGIHYYTLAAVVDGSGAGNSSYASVELDTLGDLTVTGFHRARTMTLQAPRR